MMKKIRYSLLAIISFPLLLQAQKISYSEPDRDDVRSVDFDIVGKLNNNYLVYKHVHSSYTIVVFDNEMKQADKVKMDFLPDKLINSDIITYRDYFYFIYQYQRRNVVYCMAAHIDGNGKIVGDPVTLDTTTISFFASNKIYNILYSEDKQRIGIYKINSKNENNYIFTCSVFDASLNLLYKKTNNISMQSHNDFLTEFALDNEGWMAFVKASGSAANNDDGTIQNITLMVRSPGADTINKYSIEVPKIYLSDIRIKVDNVNKHLVIASFYSKQKRGNIDGLYTATWSRDNGTLISEKTFLFNDELKSNAKSEGSSRAAFNDYFLQNIILRKDGGFAILAESAYSTNRGVYNNRWDYTYGSPYWNNSNYYLYGSPYGYTYYPWMSPYGYGYPNQLTRYYADNIAVIAFDSSDNMEWTSIIPKSQYDDNSDNFIGYGIYLTSGQANFLFNQFQKRTQILQAQSIDPQGKITQQPTLKELDRGYQFMPRYLKQVSSHEVLVPCQYRNYLCFAKIEF
ncbi:MAG: hypothetical protein JO072_11435 [Parafilimonas sp.]|nr:hypothetical protein [Parafilimonas sp.]